MDDRHLTLQQLHKSLGNEAQAFAMYENRNAQVREAAYFHALARGFAPGGELDDWLAAEREIDRKIFAAIIRRGFVG